MLSFDDEAWGCRPDVGMRYLGMARTAIVGRCRRHCSRTWAGTRDDASASICRVGRRTASRVQWRGRPSVTGRADLQSRAGRRVRIASIFLGLGNDVV